MEQIIIISTVLLWIVVAFNLLLTFALIRRINALKNSDPWNVKGLDVGKPAPNFTALTLDSQTVNIDTYKGKSIAFIFVAPHCQSCHEIIPKVESLAVGAKREGVELVFVSDVEDIVQTQDFANELNIKLSILTAPRRSNPFLDDYKVIATPFYCLIDSQWKVSSTGLLGPEWQKISQRWESN